MSTTATKTATGLKARTPVQPTAERIAAQNYFATVAQDRALHNAILAGPAALLAYARTLNARYQARAAETVDNYRLLFLPGFRYAQGVVKLADETPYLQDTNSEGVHECFCQQYQEFVTRVNDALRGAGLSYRVECKHARLAYLLERKA